MKDKTVEAILSKLPKNMNTDNNSNMRLLIAAIVAGLKEKPIINKDNRK